MKRYQLILLSLFSALLLSLPWLRILPGWILLVAFLPLLIVEEQLSLQKAKHRSIVLFGYAYLSFWVWNALTSWWIMHASLFGMFLIIFLNACFMATVWWLFHIFKRNFRSRIAGLALITIWLAFEFVHHHWDIEWPWLTLGNGFSNQVQMIQWFEYTGVLGGSLWILVVNLLIFGLYKSYFEAGIKPFRQSIFVLLAVFVPLICSWWIFSKYEEKGKPLELVILQPNIDPYTEKFNSIPPFEQLDRLIKLADSLVNDSTCYVVAPETAIPPVWENDSLAYHQYMIPFRNLINRYPDLQIIAGATTKKLYPPGKEMPKTVRKCKDRDLYYDIYNSALQVDRSGKIQVYHKSILVSGVEKMPFSHYFTFIENFIIDLGGTTGSLGSQPEPSVFKGKNGIRIAPVICYESIFGRYVSKYIQKGANLIFIITNDGWWKNSPGYEQHLSYARLRAIETRRSIARSANTGISAIINQRGEFTQRTGWWVKTAIKGKVFTNDELTFYVRYGDFIGRVSLLIATMLVFFLIVQGQVRDKKNPH